MLRYRGLRTTAPLEVLIEAFDKLASDLTESHQPTLQPTREFQANRLGVDVPRGDLVSGGTGGVPILFTRAEVFCGNNDILSVLLSYDPDESSGKALARIIYLDNTERPTGLDFDVLEKVERCFPGPLRPLMNMSTSGTRRVREFDELSHVEMPSNEEVIASRLLASRGARLLARSIKTAGDVLSDGLPTLVAKQEIDDAEAVREQLLSAGVLVSEPVIICRKTNSLVNRITEEGVLASLASLQVRCSCGEPIDAEKVEEATRISPLGHWLLEKSQWMNIVLVSELLKIDVALDDIYVEQQFGGDEVDCIAIISGDLVLFELKDGEFNLGHAYSFNAKNGMLDPDASVVVTTAHVGNDAREHFERTRRASEASRRSIRSSRLDDFSMPIFVEGIDQLPFRLRELSNRLVARDARRLIELALGTVTMRPLHLIRKIAEIDESDAGA